jgi:glycosyltransferase involved in cell wall biosynthesis
MLVLPSCTEGTPNVVLEAMALGTPIIATPVGAVPEMLAFDAPRACGLRVAPRDVEALRDAIRLLLLNPELAAEFGSRGRERAVQEYAPASVFASYKSVWRETSAAGKGWLRAIF